MVQVKVLHQLQNMKNDVKREKGRGGAREKEEVGGSGVGERDLR